MIKLVGVSYNYPSDIKALDNVTLEISEGITVIIGPNGAGKTTLLKVMGCILKPTRGKVLIDGADYWALRNDKRVSIRRKLVYVHEKPILLRGTVLDNLVYPLVLRGVPRNVAEEKALELLEFVGRLDLAHRRRKELSAGEAQLVAFLRALIVDPSYLLLDEPTNTLDLEKREIVERTLRELARDGKSIVIATHDRLLALSLAERVIVMNNGRVEKTMSRKELIEEFSIDLHELLQGSGI